MNASLKSLPALLVALFAGSALADEATTFNEVTVTATAQPAPGSPERARHRHPPSGWRVVGHSGSLATSERGALLSLEGKW
jgi:hypothetical protein